MADLPVAILVAGDPVPRALEARGSYPEMIRFAAGGTWAGPWLDVDLRSGEPLPDARSLAGVLVTGSASSVTERAAWMLRGEEYLRTLVGERTPILGICFGHQLLAQALGGRVAPNPRGREIGTVRFELCRDDPLFAHVDLHGTANQTHVDAVTELPQGASRLAHTVLDANAAIRFNERTWGVQFHPEMDGEVIRFYVEARRELIAEEGLDPDGIVERLGDAEDGRDVLRQFLHRVSSGSSGSAA